MFTCDAAIARYEHLYAQLTGAVPEFAIWTTQIEHQATRAGIRRALADMELLLAALSAAQPVTDVAAALSRAYRAELPRPILTQEDTPSGIRLPTLEEAYLDPDFRVRPVLRGDSPANEAWWAEVGVRSDLTRYLAGVLTSVEATMAPLVVLGQPGAGKSLLTKVLAARLPAADFLPARVALREVPAEAEVQDQIDYAIRAATGERVEWPDLSRSAGGAMPVVLLDGFDELLQATGVSQSDYLLKVARFQQREADQGRPVVVLVTTRTAVADRALYPEGTVALRLEPFRPEQIQGWLEIWNSLNSEYLTGCGLSPLPAQAVMRYYVLASQPLLLLMLALYDADTNALQHGPANVPDELNEATLYEQLLVSFASREVAKTGPPLPDHQDRERVEQELQRLSLVAFAMFNRHRQWVTVAELEDDLAALLGRRESRGSDFRVPLSRAEIVLGRFFFVHRAQAIQDGAQLQTFEFLHATFGEYLVARLAVQLTLGLASQRPALAVAATAIHDELLYALLSFAPLSSRQLLRFLRELCTPQVSAADRRRLIHTLITLLAESATRTEHIHAHYRPSELAVAARHGIYNANLILLILVLAPGTTARELFPGSDDPVKSWNRCALLWRSALSEPDWTDLAWR